MEAIKSTMTAKELRPGNFILMNGKPIIVTGGLIMMLDSGEHEERIKAMELKPIELTWDLLTKAGFTSAGGEGGKLSNGFCIYASLRNGWMIQGSQNIANVKGSQYLHQLQNVYYDLTGEELTIDI